jgi:microcystin-dependent protein
MARTRFKVKEGISVADDTSVDGYPLVPVGTVVAFAGSSAPEGWLLCDGSAVSRSTYANLWVTLSSTYGNGDGATTFNLPNAKGRSVVGAGTGLGLTARTVADTGGAESVTLTGAQSGTSAHGHENTISASTGTVSADHAHNANHGHTASSGGQSATHNHFIGSHSHSYKTASTATAGTNRAILTGTGSGATTGGINDESIAQAGYTYESNGGHTHSITVDANNFNTGGITVNHTHAVTVAGGVSTSTAADASSAHQNMMPFLVLNYIIKY